MPIEVNAFRELSATAAGEATSWFTVSNAPGLQGRDWAMAYVESTGGATGVVEFQVRPRGSAVIVGQATAMTLELTATETSCTGNFYVMKGMDVRAICTTHSGAGNVNFRIDLGIS